MTKGIGESATKRFCRRPTTLICGSAKKRICDLPPKLVGEKILGNAAAAKQKEFVGFMTMDSKVCSMKFLARKEDDLVDVSINQVDSLNHVEISQVFQCEGLLLCVAKDKARLLVWNPYLGQTRWIGPRTSFHRLDRYALGYDKNNRTHKILRFVDNYDVKKRNHVFGYEIYDLSSDSWKVLDVTPDWEIEFDQRGASLKGNTYFFAQEKIVCREGVSVSIEEIDDFLLCFDFATERFGPRLPLPFHSDIEETVALSCVRDEQLAVLYQQGEDPCDTLEIWVTTMIEPKVVSWMKFLKLDRRPVTGVGHVQFRVGAGSFFIDEEQKIAVVFDVDGYAPTKTGHPHHTAFIMGDDGYFKYVSLGEAPNVGAEADCAGYVPPMYYPPLVCSSSYLPSLVQINQPR
ncbi:F-box/kelch-repeat protein [Cardamine amara subsp. amara]|uniref:F-box/kelch-repeat protein n=1 Tax=Cardamine amara subsp. amara TaxID=228776 RepID=A0ABD1C1T8_CARAN